MRRTVILFVVACGGRAAPPSRPPPLEPAAVAALLDRDLAELADVAHRHREQCAELLAALRPVVARMQLHFEHVQRFAADPKLGPVFKAEVAARAPHAGRRSDQIGEDLGATYLACAPDLKERLRATIDLIPSV
jgi:hypothetical protein